MSDWSDSQITAMLLALILVFFAGVTIGRIEEMDAPRCQEGVAIVGLGKWEEGRYRMYACDATPVDRD
jgi:hypothetical protein